MAMDIMLLALSLLPCIASIDIYMCSWPTSEVIQLRCDFVNCPYLSVDLITVGRLHGNPSSCMDNNSNETLRKPIASCNYQLMESHDFFGQVKNNCSMKQVCEISTEEVFQSAGICGREVSQQNSIRNWIHIEHSCYGDIPGVTCMPITPKPTSALPSTTTGTIMRAVRRTITRRSTAAPTTKSSKSSGVALIIPVLGTLLFCTLVLIVATMLYRHGICHRKSWKHAVQDRLSQRRLAQHDSKQMSGKSQINLEELQANSSKLKELEKRLQRNHIHISNEYFHDLSFAANTTLARSSSKDTIEDIKMRTASRRGRRGSLDLQGYGGAQLPPLPSSEIYFSDTSDSTTTTDQDFDSNGRRKRRRVKPLPPLPRPFIPHSEVYFTETETESEASTRQPRRKEPLPKLDPPPKVMRDKSKIERLRLQRPHSTDSGSKQSLELALTKGAAKKLNTPTTQEPKARTICKKPMARPRTTRSTTSLYGNIIQMDENMISLTNNTNSSNNNIAKKSQALSSSQSDFRNITNR